MVYIVLFGMVGTMVVMLVWNGYKSQLNVTETTHNTASLQTAMQAMDHDVRYSAAFSVTVSGAMLRTRSWEGDPISGAFVCHGWYYDATSKVLRRTMGATNTSGATTSSAHLWPQYVDGVQGSTVFAASGDSVRVRITGKPDQWGRETTIDTTIGQRPQSEQGSSPCF